MVKEQRSPQWDFVLFLANQVVRLLQVEVGIGHRWPDVFDKVDRRLSLDLIHHCSAGSTRQVPRNLAAILFLGHLANNLGCGGGNIQAREQTSQIGLSFVKAIPLYAGPNNSRATIRLPAIKLH